MMRKGVKGRVRVPPGSQEARGSRGQEAHGARPWRKEAGKVMFQREESVRIPPRRQGGEGIPPRGQRGRPEIWINQRIVAVTTATAMLALGDLVEEEDAVLDRGRVLHINGRHHESWSRLPSTSYRRCYQPDHSTPGIHGSCHSHWIRFSNKLHTAFGSVLTIGRPFLPR